MFLICWQNCWFSSLHTSTPLGVGPELLLPTALHRADAECRGEVHEDNSRMPALCLQTESLSTFSIKVVPVAFSGLIQIVLELQCLFWLCEFINYLLASFPLSLVRSWRFYITVELNLSCPLTISSVLVRLLCVWKRNEKFLLITVQTRKTTWIKELLGQHSPGH